MVPLSLYLHIPFCRHRCAYCDFNTYTTVNDLQEAYVAALVKEIRQVALLADSAGQLRPLQTLYFGGGTPSLLPVKALQSILQCTAETFGHAANVEITLEANPEFIERGYLEGLRGIGVNRLSFGVQSAHAQELTLLERGHDFQTAVEVVNLARQVGFHNINLDLIYGLPDQHLSSWTKSVEAVLNLEPTHLSLYCLTIEPGTPMNRWLENGRINAPDPDLTADQYQLACQLLASQGFQHYEISNWSLPGYECRHNLAYWRNQEYLGLGAGAHGQAARYRYWVVKQPRVYIRRMETGAAVEYPLSAAAADSHDVNGREAMSDTVITQLRLLDEGLDMKAFAAKFGQSLDNAFDGQVIQLTEWGLLEQRGDRLLLTERGRFISNQVFYRFM
ncbi:MAG: radical SAM family heme chaperone HemW [Candidatus Promineifilaceae bacterium]|nr:radical SAM family heme chaperone HemW [Candidatus Promineifilaceae bacterium]